MKRRILNGEKIPYHEKVFLIFKPFTRWIVKGKTGVLCELGVPVVVIEDQFQFVLSHRIPWTGIDLEAAFSLVKKTQGRHPRCGPVRLTGSFTIPTCATNWMTL